MAKFFISMSKPPEEVASIPYHIDADAYIAAMQKRWSFGNIGRVGSKPYSVSWELDKETELGAAGGLFSDGTVVSFSTKPQQDAIDFALWHRAFVPKQYPLFLFDQSLSSIVELRPDMTADELRAIFS